MDPLLRGYLHEHGVPTRFLDRAVPLGDVEGVGRIASSRRILSWGSFRIREFADPRRGIGADQATELTARALLRDHRALFGASVCEVGCGTSALAVLTVRLGAARVLGVDCDAGALHLARRTAEANRVSVRFQAGNLLAGVREPFDVLVANLPQKPVPPGARLPLGQYGGRRGDELLRRFLGQAPERLKPGGRLYLFLHTLTPPAVFERLARDFHLQVAFWRCRHMAPREYPAGLLDHWLGLAAKGQALIHPRAHRPGWYTFYALQVVARRRA